MTFEAGRVDADLALRDALLEKGVVLRAGRYRVESERVRVRLEGDAARFEGDVRLSMCPCAEPPIRFGARGGRLATSGDLWLWMPRIEIGKVPVLGLPFLWLRGPDRVGVLPPVVALRGSDGALVGSGVHLPFGGTVIDLSLGGFTAGGVEVGGILRTEDTRARAVIDWVNGRRALVEARGALADRESAGALVWDLDAIRGDRARSGTVDLAPAAQAFDTAAIEGSLRRGDARVSLLAGGGLVARAVRGEGEIAAGPRASLSLGGAIARVGSWRAEASGVVLGGAGEGGGLPLGRASASAEIDVRPGPFEVRITSGARARYAGAMEMEAASSEAAAAAGAEIALPFARSFATGRGEAPLAHWITPSMAVRGALAHVDGDFFTPIGGAVPGASWVAAAGVATAIGRYGGAAAKLEVRAGASGDGAAARSLLFARLGADARYVAAAITGSAIGARVGARSSMDEAAARGAALLARARFGAEAGPWIRVEVGAQGGAGAGEARAIAVGSWAMLPGDALAYLATNGVTLGTELSVPWTASVRTGARIDADASAGSLLSVRASAAYRHPCGCLGLGLSAARRAGRDGVDVIASVDLVPPFHRDRAPPVAR